MWRVGRRWSLHARKKCAQKFASYLNTRTKKERHWHHQVFPEDLQFRSRCCKQSYLPAIAHCTLSQTWPGEFRALSDGLADYQKRMETCLAEEINKLGKDQLINAEVGIIITNMLVEIYQFVLFAQELHLALLLEMKAQSTAKNSPRGVCFLCEKKSPTSLISFPCGHKDFCQSCRDTVRKVFVSNRQIMDAIGYSRCEYNDSCPQCNFWPGNFLQQCDGRLSYCDR